MRFAQCSERLCRISSFDTTISTNILLPPLKALRILSEAVNEARQVNLGSNIEPWDPVISRVRYITAAQSLWFK